MFGGNGGYFLLLFLLHKTLSEQQELHLVCWIVTLLDFEFYRCGIQLVPTETYAETHHEANIQSLFFFFSEADPDQMNRKTELNFLH